jgi:hypothetical protein
MEAARHTINRFTEMFRKQKLVGKLVIIIVGLLGLCCLCSVPIAILNPTPKATESQAVPAAMIEQNSESNLNTTVPTTEPSNTPIVSTNTPRPTNTPKPTATPLPPTETPDPNLVKPGTYLVGNDIRPGFYRGVSEGDGVWGSCYWERLKDLSGDLGSILSNENSIGQFYIEVLSTDHALKTACDLIYLEKLPDPVSPFPQKLAPGTYLVGIDIQPGTYKGQAGTEITETCYWERLKDLKGSLHSIIANDNAVGQYYIEVGSNDFALKTACELNGLMKDYKGSAVTPTSEPVTNNTFTIKWRDTNSSTCQDISITKTGSSYQMTTTCVDGSGETEGITVKNVNGTVRLYAHPGNMYGDYMVIEDNNYLAFYDDQGLIYRLPPL